MDSAPRLESVSFCVFRHLLRSWPQGQTPERGLCAARKLGGALAVSCGSTPSPKAADPTRQPASGWRSRPASLPAQGSPVGSPWGPRPSRSPVVVTAPTFVTAKCRAPPPRGRPGRGARAPTRAEHRSLTAASAPCSPRRSPLPGWASCGSAPPPPGGTAAPLSTATTPHGDRCARGALGACARSPCALCRPHREEQRGGRAAGCSGPPHASAPPADWSPRRRPPGAAPPEATAGPLPGARLGCPHPVRALPLRAGSRRWRPLRPLRGLGPEPRLPRPCSWPLRFRLPAPQTPLCFCCCLPTPVRLLQDLVAGCGGPQQNSEGCGPVMATGP